MDKDQALIDFFKGLRIVINNASAYPKTHPYFIKSAAAFKLQLDNLLQLIPVLKINITPKSILIGVKSYQNSPLYVELAQLMHLHKIKSVEFRRGLTQDQLIDFLNKISLPIKEALKQGRLGLPSENPAGSSIVIEELDYSELLKDSGEQAKDIWAYLFGSAVKQESRSKIDEIAGNFNAIITRFKISDLYKDEELRQSVYNFLSYLKDKDKDKFLECTKDLFRLILRDKDISEENKLGKFKELLGYLGKEDFSGFLWEEIVNNDKFDSLSFKVFYQLVDVKMHNGIAMSLEEKAKSAKILQDNPKIRKKIRELFDNPETVFLPEFYRHVFSSLSRQQAQDTDFVFDRKALQENFFFVLLNTVSMEDNDDKLAQALKYLSEECDRLIAEKNFDHLRLILKLVHKKKNRENGLNKPFEDIAGKIASFTEKAVFDEALPENLAYLVKGIEKSSFNIEYYLNQIFLEGKVNHFSVKLLLGLFPGSLSLVFQQLGRKQTDLDFLHKFLSSLEYVDSSVSFEIKRFIFSFPNNVIKREVLQSLKDVSSLNRDFLFSVLKLENASLRKEALAVLSGNDSQRETVLDKILLINSPFGTKNELILENMAIAEKLNFAGLEKYLEILSKRPFFWNSGLRKKAKEALKNLHERNS
ncbi:MAG: hypothetical protein HY761_01745 [Candidatus Omnitrophica bacterium]|nr:hypothetical protein [Candidatus Omnitrophota bacterium]